MGRRPRNRLLASAVALCVAGCNEACPGARGGPRIPEIPLPPPVPEAARVPLPAPFRIRVERLRGTLGVGVDGVEVGVDLPLAETVLEVPPLQPRPEGEPLIHAYSLRLVRPNITLPVDTIVTPLNFFVRILEPRLVIDELAVEGGTIGELAAPELGVGRWLWRLRDLDLLARDVRLGGEAAEGFRIVRASAAGENRGRPFDLERLALEVERTRTAFAAEGDVDLGLTRLSATVRADRTNAWRVALVADTFAFAELRAFAPSLPAEGTGSAVLGVRGEQEVEAVLVERLDAEAGESRIAARGSVFLRGPEPRFSDVLIEAAPVHAVDVERLFEVELPGGGAWVGWVAGGGTFREGVQVRGALAHEQEGGEISRLTLEGRVRLEPDLFLDLALAGDPIRAADTAFDVSLRLRGPAAALGIRGDVVVRGVEEVTATVDVVLRDVEDAPPVVSGRALLRSEPEFFGPAAGEEVKGPIRATAEGRAVLAEGGALSVRVTADSLPLALIPFPEAVDSVRGAADGEVLLGGTIDRPTARGRLDIYRGALFIEPIALAVEDLEGALRLEEGTVVVDRLTARAGGGELEVTGEARVFDGPRSLDLALHADSVQVIATDSAEVTLSADVAVAGPLDGLRLSGQLYDVHGWIHEDLFKPRGALDLDDPPYAELAREAPWPEDSRLRRVEPEEEPPPVRGEVVVEVTPDLVVIDEDSELFGTGRLRVLATDEGLEARGLIRVEGGFYAFFGERFRVVGGVVRFAEDRFEPHVAVLGEHENGRALGSGENAVATMPERFPPLEFFGYGPAERVSETVRRWSLFPESQEELAELLIYGVEPQPVTGWRYERFWRSEDPAALLNERAEAQAVPLLWSYSADEAYDYIPLSRAWLRAGDVVVGSRYPARLVVGPLIGGGFVLNNRADVLVTQALDGGTLPGVRARWRLEDGGAFELFSIPRFYAAPAAGEGSPGFFDRRKTGVGIFWSWEF